MRIKELPARLGAIRKEVHQTRIFDQSFVEAVTLLSVDQPLPLKPEDSRPMVTINVRHPDHPAPISIDFEAPSVKVEQGLYKILLLQIGRSLSDILEIDFEPH